MERKEDELPSLFWSLTPIVLPVLLISVASFTVPLNKPWPASRFPILSLSMTAL